MPAVWLLEGGHRETQQRLLKLRPVHQSKQFDLARVDPFAADCARRCPQPLPSCSTGWEAPCKLLA